jgi:hypothetical protein
VLVASIIKAMIAQTMQHNSPEDSYLHTRPYENLESHDMVVIYHENLLSLSRLMSLE